MFVLREVGPGKRRRGRRGGCGGHNMVLMRYHIKADECVKYNFVVKSCMVQDMLRLIEIEGVAQHYCEMLVLKRPNLCV